MSLTYDLQNRSIGDFLAQRNGESTPENLPTLRFHAVSVGKSQPPSKLEWRVSVANQPLVPKTSSQHAHWPLDSVNRRWISRSHRPWTTHCSQPVFYIAAGQPNLGSANSNAPKRPQTTSPSRPAAVTPPYRPWNRTGDLQAVIGKPNKRAPGSPALVVTLAPIHCITHMPRR